jgi:hypothetical protein
LSVSAQLLNKSYIQQKERIVKEKGGEQYQKNPPRPEANSQSEGTVRSSNGIDLGVWRCGDVEKGEETRSHVNGNIPFLGRC